MDSENWKQDVPVFANRAVAVTLLLLPVWYRALSQGLVAGALLTFVFLLVGVAAEARNIRVGGKSGLISKLAGIAVPMIVATVTLRPSFGLLCGVILLAGAAMWRPTAVTPAGRILIAGAYGAVSLVIVAGDRIVVPSGVLLGAILVAAVLTWVPFVDSGIVDTRVVAAKRHLGSWAFCLQGRASGCIERVHQAARRQRGVLVSAWGVTRPWWEGWRGPLLAIALAGVAVAGALIAVRDLRVVLYDDAAITFRFAERIAGGDGFTYNVGDRTNGASAPLYTLFLALFRLAGADLEVAAKAMGIVCYSSALAGVGWLAGRARGPLAGGFAVVLLILSSDFRAQTLSGMESGFAVVLGLAAVLLWSYRYDLAAGVMLGLVVLNKLDGVALVLALCMVALLVERRVPVRMLAAAGATFAPWLVFSQIYFGSVLPFSFSQKLGGTVGDPASGYSPWWMLRGFARMGDMLLVASGAAATLWMSVVHWHQRGDRKGGAVVACGVWGLLHAGAFSILDLGDPYPWYATVVYAALAVPAGAGFGSLVRVARQRISERGHVWPAYLGIAFLVAVILAPTLINNGKVFGQKMLSGHELDDFEGFEATRRDAGRFLSQAAAEGEVVRTCFGWPSYGALQSPIDEVCPLSTRLPVDKPTWIVVTSWPGIDDLVVPPGFEPKARFVSDVGAGGGSLVVRSEAP